METKKKIHIMDTTLRDGEQTEGVSFSTEEKLSIAKYLLEKVKVDSIEITSARIAEDEFTAVKKISRWADSVGKLDKIEVLGFVDNCRSIEWIYKAGARTINLLTKGSLRHLENQIRKTKEEHVEDIKKIFKFAEKNDMRINVYLEDWSNGMKDSKDYVFYLVENLIQLGVKRIMLADTLGILDYDKTYEYVKDIKEKFPSAWFDFHGHNDYDISVSNSLAALKAGANGLHTTINGLGERTGNTKLASLVVAVNDLSDYMANIDEKELIPASKLVETFSGIRIPENMPVVGEHVFTQNCGVHADGDKKGGLYCTLINPERFGSKRKYSLGKTSGIASIDQNLKEIDLDSDLTKEQKKLVLEKVKSLAQKKEAISSEDLPLIVADVIGKPAREKVKILDYEFRIERGFSPEARVIIEIEGKEKRGNAIGDGQYDAFMNAIKRIFEEDDFQVPELVDYVVRIPPGGKTSALVETIITWNTGEKIFKTRGVDSDQLLAAIEATIKMLNILN
ncbi:MAG: alpha-isopropylmalate synthase regulatory domain-containing protein [Candidatus Woesearchaeota archaeon]